METKLTMLPLDPEAEKAIVRQDAFYDTCEKIRSAWEAKGYTGDPIISLLSAIRGMSIYRP